MVMPHIVLEYSANAVPDKGPEHLILDLHKALAKFESIKLNEIKSRWIQHENFVIGDGTAMQGFLHLRLEILSGRPLDLKKSIGLKFIELLKKSVEKASKKNAVDISLEIRDMAKETYFKAI
jgi:5-carboxymethyl-2-hydroxymuconate isomerase